MVSSISLALCVGIAALLVELPGATAKERPGYCLNMPVPSSHPSAKSGCRRCDVDADCLRKDKCCGSLCGNTCQVPEPHRCRLPPVTGPCKAAMPRFYYNWGSKRCEKFIYGGCYGNLNRFETKEECERACKGKGSK
ncbi:eppin [Anolis carolinensis]|uniref:eppin n=1 Tax=Anolis carolinensis TaxID=28377 RepID=UPI002F2B7FEA